MALDPITAAALITAGSTLLGGLLGNKKQEPAPPSSTPLTGQGIASIEIEDIGGDTEKPAENVELAGTSFDVGNTNEDTGILTALKEKIGAQRGKPINSFEDMSLEELLAVLSIDEFTDIPDNFNLEDFKSEIVPKFKMPKPSTDTGNIISLLETPDPDVISNIVDADVKASIPASSKTNTKESIASTPKEPGMSPQVSSALITGLASLIQLYMDNKDDPVQPAPRSTAFTYQSPRGGLGEMQTIGLNMGGQPSKVLARPMFKGNPVVGPGGPKDDIIPVLASDGEFMLSKAAVDHAGGGNHDLGIERLKAFNNKGNQRYG